MILRPGVRFLLSHPAHFVALGFGTGISPFAPGTVGTLLAFPIYEVLAPQLGPLLLFGVIAVMFAVGVWACGRTGRDLGIPDHSGMNWDEIVAMLLILMLTPPGIEWQALAFFGFRFFDVVKPQPIRHFDRTLKGGFGVMFDDIVAACYTLFAMAIVKLVLG